MRELIIWSRFKFFLSKPSISVPSCSLAAIRSSAVILRFSALFQIFNPLRRFCLCKPLLIPPRTPPTILTGALTIPPATFPSPLIALPALEAMAFLRISSIIFLTLEVIFLLRSLNNPLIAIPVLWNISSRLANTLFLSNPVKLSSSSLDLLPSPNMKILNFSVVDKNPVAPPINAPPIIPNGPPIRAPIPAPPIISGVILEPTFLRAFCTPLTKVSLAFPIKVLLSSITLPSLSVLISPKIIFCKNSDLDMSPTPAPIAAPAIGPTTAPVKIDTPTPAIAPTPIAFLLTPISSIILEIPWLIFFF